MIYNSRNLSKALDNSYYFTFYPIYNSRNLSKALDSHLRGLNKHLSTTVEI